MISMSPTYSSVLRQGILSTAALAFAGLTLSGCEDRTAGNGATALPGNDTVIVEDNDTVRNAAPPASGTALPALIPPAPGEVGGLPDDREPLDESPIDPQSVRGAGSVVERYAMALEQGRFADAYRLWRGNGASSGMNAADFARSWGQHSQLRVLIGRPETGGTQTAVVPVQVYGRMKATAKPFNRIGRLVLARNPERYKPGSTTSPWLIATSELAERGVVREEGSAAPLASAAVIPSAFRGRWARNANACSAPADTGELVVTGSELRFYESSGRVTKVTPDGARAVRVSALYSGEGQDWAAERRLEVSADGRSLMADDMTRVRCG
ncbi:hypothetical protein [Sphingobium subterraneum]|uniref:C-type lysozyme inhibitor domain-containing protein n=1 Tax=Sphingobium subterraneum TaxID=627688 RepID=A0A841J1Y3_9SPHN|nr:hypothetical protein [Sphingobium subterraneum]MBB6125189.1 hypothetical protein [Sphingobium subterraneum]